MGIEQAFDAILKKFETGLDQRILEDLRDKQARLKQAIEIRKGLNVVSQFSLEQVYQARLVRVLLSLFIENQSREDHPSLYQFLEACFDSEKLNPFQVPFSVLVNDTVFRALSSWLHLQVGKCPGLKRTDEDLFFALKTISVLHQFKQLNENALEFLSIEFALCGMEILYGSACLYLALPHDKKDEKSLYLREDDSPTPLFLAVGSLRAQRGGGGKVISPRVMNFLLRQKDSLKRPIEISFACRYAVKLEAMPGLNSEQEDCLFNWIKALGSIVKTEESFDFWIKKTSQLLIENRIRASLMTRILEVISRCSNLTKLNHFFNQDYVPNIIHFFNFMFSRSRDLEAHLSCIKHEEDKKDYMNLFYHSFFVYPQGPEKVAMTMINFFNALKELDLLFTSNVLIFLKKLTKEAIFSMEIHLSVLPIKQLFGFINKDILCHDPLSSFLVWMGDKRFSRLLKSEIECILTSEAFYILARGLVHKPQQGKKLMLLLKDASLLERKRLDDMISCLSQSVLFAFLDKAEDIGRLTRAAFDEEHYRNIIQDLRSGGQGLTLEGFDSYLKPLARDSFLSETQELSVSW